MYKKRIRIFIVFSLLLLAIYIVRLAQMQLLEASKVQSEIDELKHLRGQSEQLKTLRGTIYERNGEKLAYDKPVFWLHINYELSRFQDKRVQQCMFLLADQQKNPESATEKAQNNIDKKNEDLDLIISQCTHFGFEPNEIIEKIEQINNRVWNLATHIAWKRNYPDQVFEEAVPDPNDRLLLAYEADIAEMDYNYPLLELKTDKDIFDAQFEFIDINDVSIEAQAQRYYPYSTVACQTIGWVGGASNPNDLVESFEDDRLLRYQQGEVCGKYGVEYVCEAILRGRRGEERFDIDNNLLSRTETRFGQDVWLTIDIELQEQIEFFLDRYVHDPNTGPGYSAVVIDVGTSDILALVSLPVYDLNHARYNVDKLSDKNDPNQPLINRAINAHYPPGSVVKPLILIAGMETGLITADEIIPCPGVSAPAGWPNCWIFNRYQVGHSSQWINNARNAIKGSCNVYFSQLADRIKSTELQRWLYNFGYGHRILNFKYQISNSQARDFRQGAGKISSSNPSSYNPAFEEIPPLRDTEKRFFGIGQGNLQVTPLQAANAMAAIARGGIFMEPRLFRELQNPVRVDLEISEETLATVYEGMSAVVNEPGGTAYDQFSPALNSFTRRRVRIYGKTGSTEGSENAWFGGFAEDNQNRKIAFAVVVEGGQHGSSDAAPLAADIIRFCMDAGYIGQ